MFDTCDEVVANTSKEGYPIAILASGSVTSILFINLSKRSFLFSEDSKGRIRRNRFRRFKKKNQTKEIQDESDDERDSGSSKEEKGM